MRHTSPLLRLATALEASEADDAELLARFRSNRNEAAFAELVRRHGPMVLGVCLRVTRHRQDAEDAYQATFLVLARRAGDLAKPEQLAGWLHGVATRTSLEARSRARTRTREQQVMAMPEPAAPVPPDSSADLRAVLDEELGRLPEKFRVAVVLCDIEGLTREEAAARLGVPVGTLSGRLTVAHRKLAALLERRGVACAAAAMSALSAGSLTAMVPSTLAANTVEASVSAAAKGLTATGAAPSAEDLARTVLAALRASKWKTTGMLILLSAGVLVPGIGLAMQARPPVPPPEPPPTQPVVIQSQQPIAPRIFPLAPNPRPKLLRQAAIANDFNDIFVVSDLDESVPEFFRHNRTLVAPISAANYRTLAASKEPWVMIPMPVNAANDPQRSMRAGRTVPVVPPSDAVRKLLDPVAETHTSFNAIIAHEGTAGGHDIVGYTLRPVASDFFEKLDLVMRSGGVAQKDLQFAEPSAVPKTPPPQRPPRPNEPTTIIANAIPARPGATDFRIVSDRRESVVEYFRRQRVAVGCLFVVDYEKLARTNEPWLEVPVYPISFNDEMPLTKRTKRTVRVAPPSPFVETRLFRPGIRPRPDIDAFTVVFRRDEPDGVLEIVGFSSSRTSFQFFEKNVRFAKSDDLLQRDLLYRPPPAPPLPAGKGDPPK